MNKVEQEIMEGLEICRRMNIAELYENWMQCEVSEHKKFYQIRLMPFSLCVSQIIACDKEINHVKRNYMKMNPWTFLSKSLSIKSNQENRKMAFCEKK